MTLKLLAAALVLSMSTSAMARNNREHGILPGYGYSLSDKDFGRWDYVAYRYYHPNCRF